MRRLNRYVEESRPWDLAKDEAAAERLDQVLYSLVEGLRVLTLLLLPYIPETARRFSLRSARRSASSAEFGSRGGRRAGRADPAALPEDRDGRVVDE